MSEKHDAEQRRIGYQLAQTNLCAALALEDPNEAEKIWQLLNPETRAAIEKYANRKACQ